MAKGLDKKKEVKKPKKSIKEKRAAKREKKKKWFRGNEVARAERLLRYKNWSKNISINFSMRLNNFS